MVVALALDSLSAQILVVVANNKKLNGPFKRRVTQSEKSFLKGKWTRGTNYKGVATP